MRNPFKSSHKLTKLNALAVTAVIAAISAHPAFAESKASRLTQTSASAAESQLQVGSSVVTDAKNTATMVPLPGIIVKVLPGSHVTLLSNDVDASGKGKRTVRVAVESGSASVYLDKQFAKTNDFAVVTCQGEIKASDALFNVSVASPASSVSVVDGQVAISMLSGSVKTVPSGLVAKLSECGVNATASEGTPISKDPVAVKAATSSLNMLAEGVASKEVPAQAFAGVVLLVETTVSPEAAQSARATLSQLIASNQTVQSSDAANKIASADSNAMTGANEQGSSDETKTFSDGKTVSDGKTFNDGKTFADGKSDPAAPGEGPGASINALRPPNAPGSSTTPNVSL